MIHTPDLTIAQTDPGRDKGSKEPSPQLELEVSYV